MGTTTLVADFPGKLVQILFPFRCIHTSYLSDIFSGKYKKYFAQIFRKRYIYKDASGSWCKLPRVVHRQKQRSRDPHGAEIKHHSSSSRALDTTWRSVCSIQHQGSCCSCQELLLRQVLFLAHSRQLRSRAMSAVTTRLCAHSLADFHQTLVGTTI